MLRSVSLVVLTLALFACGDDDATPMDGGAGCVATILDNHLPMGGDHEMDVTIADVTSGVERSYDIRGDNTGHTHEVTLTAADFATLQSGETVTVTSSNNGSAGMSHMHDVQITCSL